MKTLLLCITVKDALTTSPDHLSETPTTFSRAYKLHG